MVPRRLCPALPRRDEGELGAGTGALPREEVAARLRLRLRLLGGRPGARSMKLSSSAERPAAPSPPPRGPWTGGSRRSRGEAVPQPPRRFGVRRRHGLRAASPLLRLASLRHLLDGDHQHVALPLPSRSGSGLLPRGGRAGIWHGSSSSTPRLCQVTFSGTVVLSWRSGLPWTLLPSTA